MPAAQRGPFGITGFPPGFGHGGKPFFAGGINKSFKCHQRSLNKSKIIHKQSDARMRE